MSADKKLDDLLRFDPIDAAEQITGDYSKAIDGRATELGLVLAVEHGRQKREALTARGDTTGCDDLDRYLAIIEGAGFERALEEPFEGRRGTRDTLFAYARSDGLFLAFDTYFGGSTEVPTSVNSGKLWYNWLPGKTEARWRVTSSGSFARYGDPDRPNLWVGDHDCREAVLHNIRGLTENGTLCSPWEARPAVFWITSYMDWDRLGDATFEERSRSVEQLTADRIARMPAWVREMITP